MSPQLEPILESHLAAILMGELLRPREDLDDTYVDIVLDDLDLDDDEFYASYELVHEPAPAQQDPTMFAAPTTKFVRVRDTSHDHIDTKKYPREALDADTLQTPKYSAPYELIDIDIAQPPIVAPVVAPPAPSYPNAQVPLNSAPYDLVDIAPPIVVPVVASLAAEFTFYSNAKFPLNSAPYERVDLDDYSRAFVKAPSAESLFMNAAPTDWSAGESTEVLSPPQTASRVIATIVVLVGALLLGLTIALYY